eukprot:271454-Pyramimonas_sp.AAC.1
MFLTCRGRGGGLARREAGVPHFMLVIRAGHRQPVIVATFGLLRLQYGGSIKWGPCLRGQNGGREESVRQGEGEKGKGKLN